MSACRSAVLHVGFTYLILCMGCVVGQKQRVATTVAVSCSNQPQNVFFLLTSTPTRAARLMRVVETMRQQTLRPRGIILTVAERYDGARFENHTSFSVPEGLRQFQSVASSNAAAVSHLRLHKLRKDLGPISKYHGAADLPTDAIVVVGDDDMYYGSTFIEDYACAVAKSAPDTVFSSGIDPDCIGKGVAAGCVMGFRGIGMRAGMLHGLSTAMQVPDACYLADDLAITFYLAHLKGFQIRRLRLRTKYRFDHEFAWSNSSINTYHRQRSFRVNKACAASLQQLRQSREGPRTTDVGRGET